MSCVSSKPLVLSDGCNEDLFVLFVDYGQSPSSIGFSPFQDPLLLRPPNPILSQGWESLTGVAVHTESLQMFSRWIWSCGKFSFGGECPCDYLWMCRFIVAFSVVHGSWWGILHNLIRGLSLTRLSFLSSGQRKLESRHDQRSWMWCCIWVYNRKIDEDEA